MVKNDFHQRVGSRLLLLGVAVLVLLVVNRNVSYGVIVGPDPPPELDQYLAAIADLTQASPLVKIPEGWFFMGTIRKYDDPFGLETQFDNTEFPQRRIWLDAYSMDRDEVSMGEYLAFLTREKRDVSGQLRRLIWHLISVHALPDYVMAR